MMMMMMGVWTMDWMVERCSLDNWKEGVTNNRQTVELWKLLCIANRGKVNHQLVRIRRESDQIQHRFI
jgi:hypothetical protein